MFKVYVDKSGSAKLRGWSNRVRDNLPRALSNDTRRITNTYCAEMRMSLMQNELRWSGNLYRSIRPIKEKNGWSIKTPAYGDYIDSSTGKKDWIVVPRGKPQLEQWAEEHGLNPDRRIHIHTRNWQRPAFNKARTKLKQLNETGEWKKVVRLK